MDKVKGIRKKRIKKALKDEETYLAVIMGTAVLGFFPFIISLALLGLEIANEKLGLCASWSFGGAFIIWLLIFFIIAPIQTCYDEEIEMEEAKVKKDIKNEKREPKKKEEENTYLQDLSISINKLGEEHEDVIENINEILTKIISIIEKGILDKSKEHYIRETLPMDIGKAISSFSDLNKENQGRMKGILLELLKKKKRELDENFIAAYEEEKMKEFTRQIKIAETREF